MNDPAAACYVPLGVVEIRPATPVDHPIIASLAHRIWHVCFRDMITTEQIDYMLGRRYTAEALAEATRSGQLTYEILRVDGEPLAFTAYGPSDHSDELKLQQLYVHPDWQGRGLGGRLMDRVEAHARQLGRRKLVLTVNRGNHRARAAYEKRGFTIREAAVFDIGNGFVMDDYVMEKVLDP